MTSTFHEFTVEGASYALVDAGDVGRSNGKRAADDLAKLARQDRQLWGLLPFARYVVFNLFRPGGGGLEHRNSALLTADASAATKDGYHDWLVFVSHEYFHAYNGKRLGRSISVRSSREAGPHAESVGHQTASPTTTPS